MRKSIALVVEMIKYKIDVNLFLFVLLISMLKFFVFHFFDETVALFSADFVIGNVLLATLAADYRKVLLFLFNTIYFIVFIALTFSNFFHFSLRSLIDAFKFYGEVSLSKYLGTITLLILCLVTLALLIRYLLIDRKKKGAVINLAFNLGFLLFMYVFQALLFTDYSRFANLAHSDYKKTFFLFNKGDLTTMILSDNKFAFGYSIKNKILPVSKDQQSSFLKYSSGNSQAQVFVLMESMGKFTSGPFRTIFQDSIHQWIKDKQYTLIVDSVRFEGATIDGELRELFNVKGDYNVILNSDQPYHSFFTSMHNRGFKTFSFSSSSGKVFSDRILYGKGGCQVSLFKEELMALPAFNSEQHVNTESAFSGISDEYTFDCLLSAFQKEKTIKKAAYFLTINTHLPFELNKDVAATKEFQNFSKQFEPVYDKEVIEHTYKFLQQLKYFINRSMDNEIGSILFAGDHSPPFFQPAQRVAISQQFVPVYVVQKKGA